MFNRHTADMDEEDDVNYASVVFKTKTNPKTEVKREEEIVYDEVKVPQRKAEQSVYTNAMQEEENLYDEVNIKAKQSTDKIGLLAEKKDTNKNHHYLLMACCMGTFCVILLLGIIAASVYFALYYHNETALKELKDNQTTLEEINRNLTDQNNKLREENERLMTEKDNQTVIIGSLTQKYNVSEMKVEFLTVQNQDLNTENQELEKEKKNLTEQIRNIKTDVTVAQQIIDDYCPPKDGKRNCSHCQKDWLYHQSSCYVIHNPSKEDEQKTWERARENCRGKNSDLAVIVNGDEKTFIKANSYSGINGYWIGLRAEAGKWKWINGSDLTEKSWMKQPANNGSCAISVHNQEWNSTSCEVKNGWICKKAPLSV